MTKIVARLVSESFGNDLSISTLFTAFICFIMFHYVSYRMCIFNFNSMIENENEAPKNLTLQYVGVHYDNSLDTRNRVL